jgi:hypothetical protein
MRPWFALLMAPALGCSPTFGGGDTDAAAVIDAAIDAPPDAQQCFGSFVNICLSAIPSAPLALAITDADLDIDTVSSALCDSRTTDYCVLAGTSISIAAGRTLRAHGSKPKYYHKLVGGNFRLDAIQGAVVSAKLPHLDKWTAGRQANAARYDKLFAESGIRIASSGDAASVKASAELLLPKTVASRHIFNQYVVRTSDREALRKALEAAGVSTEIYYPVPMHLQECFASLGYKAGQLPESERAADETLALPIYPELTDAQARYVVDVVRDFFVAARAAAPKKVANT